MTEKIPGVTVKLVTTAAQKTRNHPEGDAIRVDDAGHLHVTRNNDVTDVVAIYAPEKWTYATVGGDSD